MVYRICKAAHYDDACRENEGGLGGKQSCGGHCCRTGRGTIAAVMAIPIRALHKVRTDLHRNFADSGSRNLQKSFGRLHSAEVLPLLYSPHSVLHGYISVVTLGGGKQKFRGRFFLYLLAKFQRESYMLVEQQ